MKLAELTTDILYTDVIEGNQISFVYHINEGMFDIHQIPVSNTDGGFVKGIKDVGKFMTNPVVMGLATSYAQQAYRKYKHNKKYTTRFFAKSHSEKPFYEKIVAELMKTGHYKKVTQKNIEGGYIWELERDD